MSERVQIVGSFLSPYVRKVLVCLHLKGIAFEIDPIVPFLGDDRFSKLSPLRRIPVFIDDWVTLCDSSVICQYLEDRYPRPSLYPLDLADRAHARWLEEFADTRMGEVFIWRLFNQVAIRRAVWDEDPDTGVLAKALNEEIPAILDYLEYEVPDQGFLYENLCLADISIASFFRNAAFARFTVDAARWPRTAAYVTRVLSSEGFTRFQPYEERCARTPIAEHRKVLADMGAPLMKDTYGTTTPRRGVMSI
ncbi:MAG TPA: glutathione S-transferase family protein [Candidatus Binatia bacterium]|nr:glutathione S-transferase family protein [Candidatus Binatia bacterium]